MKTAVLVVHSIVSLGLIFFVLLHAGRGGGLSEVFGGAASSTFSSSSIIQKNLDRITIGLAVIFAITTVVLLRIW